MASVEPVLQIYLTSDTIIPDKTAQLLTEILGRPGAMIRHSGRTCRDESYLLLRVTQQELEALITDKAETP